MKTIYCECGMRAQFCNKWSKGIRGHRTLTKKQQLAVRERIKRASMVEEALENLKTEAVNDLDSMEISELNIIGENLVDGFKSILRRFRIKDTQQLEALLNG